MTLVSKSLWFYGPKQVKIETEILQCQEGQVVIKSLYSGISLGTESLVLNGQVPNEIAQLMKIKYQRGSFHFPIKYGYSLIGEVISEGDLIGKFVHVMHPHQTYAVVEKSDLFLLDEDISLKTASLLSNTETAVNAIWDGKPILGEKIAVVGFGLVGSLIARILKEIQGFEVWINDVSPLKCKLAKAMGFKIIDGEGDEKFDLIFHCSGDYKGLQKSIELGDREARIVELSWYGIKKGKMNLGGSFHYRRHTIISSQVSTMANKKWSFEYRKRLCQQILSRKGFSDHISLTVPFSQVQDIYNDIDNIRREHLGVVITY